MQLTIDSNEPLEKVLGVIGALYGVELAAPDAVVATPKTRTRKASSTSRPASQPKSRGRTRKAAARPSRRASAARPDPASVRMWAKANGHEVRDRGRVPANVTAAYVAAGAPTE